MIFNNVIKNQSSFCKLVENKDTYTSVCNTS